MKTLPDGIYFTTDFSGTLGRRELIKGVWYISDGTGWKHKCKKNEVGNNPQPAPKRKLKKTEWQ